MQNNSEIGEWHLVGNDLSGLTILTDPKPSLTQSDIDDATLRYEKSQKKQSVYKKRSEMNGANLVYDGKEFWMDQASQDQFIKSLTTHNLGVLSMPVTWTLADESTADLDATDLTNIATAMQDREKSNYDHARTLINQINQATDMAGLDAIDINSGWS